MLWDPGPPCPAPPSRGGDGQPWLPWQPGMLGPAQPCPASPRTLLPLQNVWLRRKVAPCSRRSTSWVLGRGAAEAQTRGHGGFLTPTPGGDRGGNCHGVCQGSHGKCDSLGGKQHGPGACGSWVRGGQGHLLGRPLFPACGGLSSPCVLTWPVPSCKDTTPTGKAPASLNPHHLPPGPAPNSHIGGCSFSLWVWAHGSARNRSEEVGPRPECGCLPFCPSGHGPLPGRPFCRLSPGQ